MEYQIMVDDEARPKSQDNNPLNSYIFYAASGCWLISDCAPENVDWHRNYQWAWKYNKNPDGTFAALDPREELSVVKGICANTEQCINPAHMRLSIPQSLKRERDQARRAIEQEAQDEREVEAMGLPENEAHAELARRSLARER